MGRESKVGLGHRFEYGNARRGASPRARPVGECGRRAQTATGAFEAALPATESLLTTIAVINQKGGVGKTTTTVNLGAGLALHGYRVLLIDLDPQANLTSHLEWESTQGLRTTYDLLCDQVPIEELIVRCAIPNLHLIPSSGDLAAAEVELSAEIGREFILRNHLERAKSAGLDYDFILIDCAPSLGLLALNALTAADEALVPIQAEFFALAGMARFMEVQALVQERLNPGLSLAGIVICMWKGQANLSREVRHDVHGTFGEVLYETVIRQNVKLAEAPSQGRTIYEYAPESNGAVDYGAITAEFLVRHGYEEPGEIVCDVVSSDQVSAAADDARVADAAADEARADDSAVDDSVVDASRADDSAVDNNAEDESPVSGRAADETAADDSATDETARDVTARDASPAAGRTEGEDASGAPNDPSAQAQDNLEIVDSPGGGFDDKRADVRETHADEATGRTVSDSSRNPSLAGANELPGPDSGRPISAGGGAG